MASGTAACGALLALACGVDRPPEKVAAAVAAANEAANRATAVATDGQVFSGRDSEDVALKTSAAHDLGCPIADVTIQKMLDQYGKRKWAVDGCGRRAFYFWNPINTAPSTYEYHAVLQGIVPLASPTTQ
jgi:hypothetical protein